MPARISLINLILWSFAFNCLSSKVSPRLLGNKMKWALTIGEQNNLTCLPKDWEEWPRPEQQGLPGGEIRNHISKLKENFHIQEWKLIAIPRQQFQEACTEDQDRARAQWDRWSRRRRRAPSQPVSERRLGSDHHKEIFCQARGPTWHEVCDLPCRELLPRLAAEPQWLSIDRWDACVPGEIFVNFWNFRGAQILK